LSNMYSYNTSTARKLSTDYGYRYDLKNEFPTQNTTTQKTQNKSKTKAKPALGRIVAFALLFAAAFVIVNGYVAINEANNEISQLRDEYNNVLATNQSIQVKIDKTIDLNQLQSIAGEKLGMVRPERYQMFYVDLEMGDKAESSAKAKTETNEKAVAVTGAPGIITGTLNIFQ